VAVLALSHGRIDIYASAASHRREEKPKKGSRLQYNRGDIGEERYAPGHAWICHVDGDLIRANELDEQQLRLAVPGQLADGLGLIQLLQDRARCLDICTVGRIRHHDGEHRGPCGAGNPLSSEDRGNRIASSSVER
jgi:hypothetical protein